MMNSGPVEEVGKAAASTIDALKATPVVLALVIFNVVFMLMTGYLFIKSSQRWDGEMDRMHGLVEKVLANCGKST